MEKDIIKQKAIEQFTKNAEKYVLSKSHAKGEDLSLLADWLQPQSNWLVLDIATGGGHVAKTLSPHVKQVFATDITKEMLANTQRHLNEYNNIFYIMADAENLPFLNDTFDVVTCRIAPHHFPNTSNFINEVTRVLKRNGLFLMIDNVTPKERNLAEFMNRFEKLRDESHARCLSTEEWRELFSTSNLLEVKSNTRKKTYPFSNWVERTANDQQQINKVIQFILNANQETKSYFNVKSFNKKIQSIQVDEWMVLCKKGN
ncbi:SAM-dependent methyltransferase [Anaerobacillus arseniciselenatis]|uniref:SAM-dependent methyltransferase n=1 Tax=Anaerobacillus arseniciselenatis TaxID=85682 RepID=A0A1S2LS38_9BACI|nr:class I SAM-dependent methyltransferase [Anaerobacillus arseniciselenatis]OIJ15196.1 SAM-dependent methyltransferase [Anaerobacillus arseniciselenatis]